MDLAMSSSAQQPALCRVRSYSLPGFPNPTIKRIGDGGTGTLAGLLLVGGSRGIVIFDSVAYFHEKSRAGEPARLSCRHR
jgi:hypothetical protein